MMSKRKPESEIAEPQKVSKKIRKNESVKEVSISNAEAALEKKRLKKERKQEKRDRGVKKPGKENGRQEQSNPVLEETDGVDDSGEADSGEAKKLAKEAKEADKARKAAKLAGKLRKAEVIGADSGSERTAQSSARITEPLSRISSTTSPEPVHKTKKSSSAYTPPSKLSSSRQEETDAYLAAKEIKVIDSLSSGDALRPITKFIHLPDDVHKEAFKGFSAPTPVQAATWPYMLNERDVIGVAETGSGKTLAFGVPCIQRILALPKTQRKGLKAAIVSPTRELACQIHEQLVKLAEPVGLRAVCVYGGVPKDAQRAELKRAHIVVATPGRLNDLMCEGAADLSGVEFACLDEADRMLDKGFEDDIRKILGACAPTHRRQTVMFTATWPQSVRDLASTFMTTPVQVYIGGNPKGELQANARIQQSVEVMDPQDKYGRLVQILREYQKRDKKDRILIFCLYKKEATRVEDFIRNKGFRVAGIHGDLSQIKRTASLESFKNGDVPLLVATDVAARGLDIPAVKLVLNVTFPLTAEDYVHRIGRTGRAGQDGKAITFFTDHEKHLSGALISVLKSANQPVPEELLKFGTTVKKKEHAAYGAFFKDVDTAKKATKITFD